MKNLLAFENISISFDHKPLISGLTFSVQQGDKVVIRGESGSGKSSLLNTLTGFTRPSSGTILFEDTELHVENFNKFRKQIAFLPQQVSFNNLDVRSFIELPFGFQRNKSSFPSEEKIKLLFTEFSLKHDILNSRMQDISGGEKQRVALISCLLLGRNILLLDEPTSALDSQVKQKVMDYIFKQDELVVISASHDPEWVERCTQIVDI